MTLEEIKKEWPKWRIEFVCDYACEKLRNLLHINYVFLESDEWDYWMSPEDEEYRIKLKFENQTTGNYVILELMDELFMAQDLTWFDKKTGADKMTDIRDKVILRLAWHLKEKWEGRC